MHPPSAQQNVDFAHLVGQFISIRINTMPEAWQPHNNFIDIVVKIVSGFKAGSKRPTDVLSTDDIDSEGDGGLAEGASDVAIVPRQGLTNQEITILCTADQRRAVKRLITTWEDAKERELGGREPCLDGPGMGRWRRHQIWLETVVYGYTLQGCDIDPYPDIILEYFPNVVLEVACHTNAYALLHTPHP